MNTQTKRIAWLICVASLGACGRPAEELTATKPYADHIGTEYRLLTAVTAYGIYENLDDRKAASYVTLMPGAGIGGPEVAFGKRLAAGTSLTLVSAWRKPVVFGDDIYYLVNVKNADLPEGIEVRLGLSRGNESVDAGLNPGVYKKVE